MLFQLSLFTSLGQAFSIMAAGSSSLASCDLGGMTVDNAGRRIQGREVDWPCLGQVPIDGTFWSAPY